MQSLTISKLPLKNAEPQQFLRYCFNIDHLLPEEMLEEISFSYCTQCVQSLSKILGIQTKTVRSWGIITTQEGMRQYARMTCNYAQLALSKEELYRIINQDFDAPKFTAISLHNWYILLLLFYKLTIRHCACVVFRVYLNIFGRKFPLNLEHSNLIFLRL